MNICTDSCRTCTRACLPCNVPTLLPIAAGLPAHRRLQAELASTASHDRLLLCTQQFCPRVIQHTPHPTAPAASECTRKHDTQVHMQAAQLRRLQDTGDGEVQPDAPDSQGNGDEGDEGNEGVL